MARKEIIPLEKKLTKNTQAKIHQAIAALKQKCIDDTKKKYLGKTLFGVSLNPDDDEFLRGIFETYKEALDHIRQNEIYYHVEQHHRQTAMSIVNALANKIPTEKTPIDIVWPFKRGRPDKGPNYRISAVNSERLIQLIEYEFKEWA